LLVALNRPDVYLTGDLALRRAIQRVYGFERAPTELELAEISDHWRPYRSLAVSYLFASEYEGNSLQRHDREGAINRATSSRPPPRHSQTRRKS
jgi:3-methyladenine DNA glycosylase/8-oxoguanine DNA glycosylase